MTAPAFTKFDPRAFLENEERRGAAAKPAKAAKAPEREAEASATLATFAALAAHQAGSQNPAALVGDRAPAELLAPLFKPTSPAVGEPEFEQPCVTRRGRVEVRPDGVFLHFCAECGAWGAFGYGVLLRAGRTGRWYCGKHRPE